MTDIHSHLIYGIDDGARSLEESIELIKKLSSIGFDNLIITPHYIEDSEYSASNEIKEEKLEIIRDELKKNNINVNIFIGNEIFINEINPKYSIISVGKNNRYGHPNKEALNNLSDSKIYRTDQDGSIMFKIKNNKLRIETCSS